MWRVWETGEVHIVLCWETVKERVYLQDLAFEGRSY